MANCRTDLSLYVKQIGEYPLLSKEEETALAKESKLCGPTQNGDPLGLTAKQRLVCCNTRLVVSRAKALRGPSDELDDLISAGNIGLEYAARRFDPGIGARFSTYATYWIDNFVRLASRNRYLVHVPDYCQDVVLSPHRAYRGLPECIVAAKIAMQASKASYTTDEEGTVLDMVDVLPAPLELEPFAAEERKELVADMLVSLSPQQRDVLRMRFLGEKMSLAQVGEVLNLSRERVRQVQAAAIVKLKTKYYEFKD